LPFLISILRISNSEWISTLFGFSVLLFPELWLKQLSKLLASLSYQSRTEKLFKEQNSCLESELFGLCGSPKRHEKSAKSD